MKGGRGAKIQNGPKAIERLFKKYEGGIEIAGETSSNAFWVADLPAPVVRKAHIGLPSKIRRIAEAPIKTEGIDAGILAELLRAAPPPQDRLSCAEAGPK